MTQVGSYKLFLMSKSKYKEIDYIEKTFRGVSDEEAQYSI